MSNKKLISTILTFCFGFITGVFFTIIVIREAFPLRDHYIALMVCGVSGAFIVLVLILWYFRVVNASKRILGDKGGGIINTILSFLLVSVALLFIVVVGIFYAAIV